MMEDINENDYLILKNLAKRSMFSSFFTIGDLLYSFQLDCMLEKKDLLRSLSKMNKHGLFVLRSHGGVRMFPQQYNNNDHIYLSDKGKEIVTDIRALESL
jgi:hypothetical protein